MVGVDILTLDQKGEIQFYDGDKDYTGPFVFMFFCDNGTITFNLKDSKSLALKIENVIVIPDKQDYIEIPVKNLT